MSFIVRPNTPLPKAKAWTVNQPVLTPAERQRLSIPTRRAEIAWIDADGRIDDRAVVIPALPVFQDAFSAIAQGALMQTPDGPVAVEDLQPGMKLACADGPAETIRWIGSMTLLPAGTVSNLPETPLYRLTDGGYGLDPQAPDLLLGPAARILPALMATDSSSPLRNVDDLADGLSVVPIRPVSAVRVFHVALSSHRLIRANGVLVESYHPGSDARLHLSREMFDIFLALFPHLKSEGDFGPLNHRRTARAN